VWSREVTDGGYRAPLKDGTKGGNDKLDVYLADIGDESVYGYCVNEKRVKEGTNAFSGYCVVDDDYDHSEFPINRPKQNLEVTAAHEFFHAVQFAYDAWDDPWFMESTATWIEDEVYDGVNDNRFYLRNSPLTAPQRPLDYDGGSLHMYGAWIWWRYLTERFPATEGSGLPVLVRKVWQAADSTGGGTDRYSLKALDHVVGGAGQVAQLYGGFSTANRRPENFYSEGAAYPSAPRKGPYELTRRHPSISWAPRLDHLASKTAKFKPSGAATRLRFNVNGPDAVHRPVVKAVVVRTNGSTSTSDVALDSSGNGQLTVPFDKATVSSVDLTLTVGGHAYKCWSFTDWSCAGRPQDADLKFAVTASRLS
jgi:hypothetical protein